MIISTLYRFHRSELAEGARLNMVTDLMKRWNST